MHECPACGFSCDCDGDDLWRDFIVPGECACNCDAEWNDDVEGCDFCGCRDGSCDCEAFDKPEELTP